MFSENDVDYQIEQSLNTKYHIPQSLTNKLSLGLVEIIKKGRDNKTNIIPKILTLIQENQVNKPRIVKNYKKRIEENKLFKILDKKGVLLLTGVSLCGKTEISKTIASNFIDKGANFFQNDKIIEIERFLNQNPLEDKIIIFEDPWGHIIKHTESLNIKENIVGLLKNVQENHKLIITSKLDIIYDVWSTNDLSECKILDNCWIDLTIKNPTYAKQFWLSLTSDQNISKTTREQIGEYISNSDQKNLLQVDSLLI